MTLLTWLSLGSTCIAAVCRTLMKLSLGVNFINILRAHFIYEILAPKITKLWFGFEIFWRQNIGKNAPAKCWWNNTSKRERTHSIKVLNSTFEQMELNSCCVHLFDYGNEEDNFFEVTFDHFWDGLSNIWNCLNNILTHRKLDELKSREN